MKKYLYILFISFLFSCEKCEKFERNPNLELLLKDNWNSFFNPVWSPDSENIYYLRAHRDNLPTEASSLGIGGELWKINLKTRKTKFLLKGPFCALAISPDGNLLALSYEIGENEIEWEGGPLILVDTAGNILDTLNTSLSNVTDVKFSKDGSKLYFAGCKAPPGISPGIYTINLDGTEEKLIKETFGCDWIFFYLSKDDSIVFGKGNFNYVKMAEAMIWGDVILGPAELKIKNLLTGEIFIPDADPYGPPKEHSGFESAYWSPDGEKLIISVGEVEGGCLPAQVSYLELWILHKVW